MKNVLVFGATGNIGVYLVDYLKEQFADSEYRVIAVGRRNTSFFEEQGIEYLQVDVTKDEDFNKLPSEDVYGIVNLTGLLPAYFKDYNPYAYVETNINGSIRILEYARRVGVDRVIYTQTWAEQAGYWGKEEVLSPDLPRKLLYTGDHAFYSISKCMVVDTMEFYKQEYGIKNFVFRLPNVYLYSPEMNYYVDGIAKPIGYRMMIERAAKGEDMELWGNPDAFKDMLYVKDLCQMMYRALLANVDGGTYNAGTGVRTTLREQIEGMLEVFAPEGTHPQIIYRPEKPSFTSFVMDIENIKRDLGYEPRYYYLDYLRDYKEERERNRFAAIMKKGI